MEQATVTTLTAIKEARSMRKKHSGNIFRYGKDLPRKNSYREVKYIYFLNVNFVHYIRGLSHS